MVARAAKNPPFTEKYDVECVLGRGGMGTIFEARHRRLGHHVAIKVLGEDLRLQPELVKRFEREAHAAGALSSPHAVKIYDIDQTDDGTPFMVMELLHGRDLAHVLAHDGAQSIGDSVRWVIEACDAIGEAHRLGIVHRDIKPSNLFLCRGTGMIKVLDFGIAKRVAPREAAITVDVAPLGTPQYMSPEQARCAKDVDARADIWSLGVTLYELLCGRPPFDHDVSQACIAAVVADPVPDPRALRPGLPEALVAVLMRALAKDPNERLHSVDALVQALAPFVDVPTPEGRTLPPSLAIARAPARTPRGKKRVDEQTVPPAIARMSARASRVKRVRSSIALAGAVVLGFGVVAAVPRCVGARLDAAPSSVTASRPASSGALVRAAALPVEPPIARAPAHSSARLDDAEAGGEHAQHGRDVGAGGAPHPGVARAPRPSSHAARDAGSPARGP